MMWEYEFIISLSYNNIAAILKEVGGGKAPDSPPTASATVASFTCIFVLVDMVL